MAKNMARIITSIPGHIGLSNKNLILIARWSIENIQLINVPHKYCNPIDGVRKMGAAFAIGYELLVNPSRGKKSLVFIDSFDLFKKYILERLNVKHGRGWLLKVLIRWAMCQRFAKFTEPSHINTNIYYMNHGPRVCGLAWKLKLCLDRSGRARSREDNNDRAE